MPVFKHHTVPYRYLWLLHIKFNNWKAYQVALNAYSRLNTMDKRSQLPTGELEAGPRWIGCLVLHSDAASRPGSQPLLPQTHLLCLSCSYIQGLCFQRGLAAGWLAIGRRQCSSWLGEPGDWLKFDGPNTEKLWDSVLRIMNQGLSNILDKEELQLPAKYPLLLWSSVKPWSLGLWTSQLLVSWGWLMIA